MTTETTLHTFELEIEANQIKWPEQIHDDVYTLLYHHSDLQLNKEKLPLYADVLYEAWAFDGEKSWHIWKRDNDWVCSEYDTTQDHEDTVIRQEQLLANHFAKSTGKKKLVIYERLAYDDDAQAYIDYSCPIDLK